MPRFLHAIVILVALVASASLTSAQAYSVPAELEPFIGQQNVDGAGEQAIEGYVGARARDLTGGQPAAISAAREDLLAPLVAASQISVSFRLTYAEELLPTLTRLIDGNDEIAAIAAARIAGELGTGQSLDLLLDALDAGDPSRRYAVVQALGATLRLIAEANPALQAARASEIISALASIMEEEPSAFVVDAAVRAFSQAQGDPGLRTDAIQAAAEAMAAQVTMRRAMASDDRDAMEAAASTLRAVVGSRDFFIAVGAGVPGPTANAVLRMAGHAMAYGLVLVEQRGVWESGDSAEADTVDAMLIAAEAVAGLSYLSLTRQQVNEQPILRAVQNRDARALRGAVDGWIGNAGRICRPPINADPADFN